MFDMQRWSTYLDEWRWNAVKDGATTTDLLELFYLQVGCLLPRLKAEECGKGTND